MTAEGQLRVKHEEMVQWRPLGQWTWIDLIDIDTLLDLALGSDVATDFEIGTVTTGAPGDAAAAAFTEVAANLYRLDLTLPRGDAGPTGPTGPSIELRRGTTHIQWRVVGQSDWVDLIDLTDLKGATGTAGTNGKSAYQEWLDAGNTGSAVDFLASLKGQRGEPGTNGLNGGAAFNRARATISTTEALTPGETFTEDVLLGASYRLLRVASDSPARVRAYTTAAKRAADAARSATTVPTGDHGVLLDTTTTTGVLSIDLSPAVDGWDAKSQPDGYAPFAITNTGDDDADITVTITYLRTE